MPGTLCDQLLDAHRLSTRARAARSQASAPLALRPDHVVIEGDMAALTLRLFETIGRSRSGTDLLLVGAGGRLPGDETALENAARRHDAVFSRDGNGAIHRVHAARFAAPGRLVVGADPRLLASGAFGMLALMADPVELAAILAGEPVALNRPEVMAVRLLGRAPDWVAGDDVALALERGLGHRELAGQVLEFHVLEPEGLSFAARGTIARQSAGLGALSSLFPADEATRRYLRQQERETDWKPQTADPDPERPLLDLDFSDLEPLVGGAPGETVVTVRERAGQAVDAVWVGPDLALEELGRLVARLEGGRVHERVTVVVSLGDRQVHASAAAAGWIGILKRAGATVVAADRRGRPTVPAGSGLCLACGAPRPERHTARWRACGPETCVAAALSGALTDPRSLPPRAAVETPRIVIDDRLLERPTPEARAAATEPAPNGVPIAPPIVGPLRGTVLLKLGDRVGVDRILPWGARVRPLGLQVEALKHFVFAAVDREFCARATAHSGGWVVAGRDLGVGPRREQIAMIAVRLGLRAMLALGFDPGFRAMLLQHGILALRFLASGDYLDVCTGDELEIPDLPEALEEGKPLGVRNLTRGMQYAVHHDLEEDQIEEVRAGGRLASARQRAPGNPT